MHLPAALGCQNFYNLQVAMECFVPEMMCRCTPAAGMLLATPRASPAHPLLAAPCPGYAGWRE